jgi:tetratricopeptide (TPR) repeat protein
MNLESAGHGHQLSGDSLAAIDCFRQALGIRREAGDRRGEAAALGNLGKTYAQTGQLTESVDRLEQALASACSRGACS